MSDEFWSQVSKSDGCWEWRGPVSPDGYGRTTVDGVRWFTHRYAYTVQRGEIPAGLVIDHLCRNRRCCNPDHLEPVTARENILRGVGVSALNAAKTHCGRGHLLDEANVYVPPKNPTQRHCRACKAIHNRKKNDRLLAERAEARSRRVPPTHCVRGHEFSEENTIVSERGRACRSCKSAADARRYAAKAAAKAAEGRARAAHIPTGLDHLTIEYHYRPAEDRYAWDPRNLASAGIWKAAQDALHAHRGRNTAGARGPKHPIVHDDSPGFMTEIGPTQHPARKGEPAATWLVIRWTHNTEKAS